MITCKLFLSSSIHLKTYLESLMVHGLFAVDYVTNDKIRIIDSLNDCGKRRINPVSGDKNESPFHYQISSWIYKKSI